MPGKLPTVSRWPVSMFMQIDARVALPVGHVGDGVGRRREARREHEVVAAREIAHVGAVLIHEREPLDAAILRPGLVDEDDAAVEIALLAGDPLVDGVRDDVGDAPPVVGRGGVLLAASCWPANTSHSRNWALSRPSVCGEAAGDQRLRVDLRASRETADWRRCWRSSRDRRPDRSARTGRSAAGWTAMIWVTLRAVPGSGSADRREIRQRDRAPAGRCPG